ncbi:murein hydrolase activator EnvC family protein [Salinimicrobium xinjiangense]|uniref:murein hydrolase activator EnvC family protein n=1 Tax=Salinimicrobium xinjiangense TaxID=438596 RepID=UPI00056A1A1A|nr:peptidoglycan DD-metalloendopeptidase family protein [Salinimicrobium xinjiangense]
MSTRILFKYCLVAVIMLISLQAFSQADKREELEQRRLELQQEISRINSLRTSNLKKEKSILTEVEDLQQQIRSTENLIRVTNQQANLLTREINNNQNKIGELRKELEQLKEDYSKMIARSYKSKSQQSRVMFLLSSENFLQAYKRLQYMKQYANYRHQQGEEIKIRTEELQKLNNSLAEQKKAKDQLIAENRKTRAELEKNRKAQAGLIAEVRKKEGQFASQLRQKQQEINAIDKEIERIIAEAIAANNKEEGSTSREIFKLTPEAKALAANFASNKGKLPWPVRSGTVSMRFGNQPHPVVKSITINSNGVRIDTEPNGKAKAIFGGVVSEVQAVKGANKAVMVRHGDYISIYNNLDKIYVRKGDQVSIGQELGEVATSSSTGKTTLHFLLYQNSTKLNPEQWIYQM